MGSRFRFEELNIVRYGSIFLSIATSEVQMIQKKGSVLSDIS